MTPVIGSKSRDETRSRRFFLDRSDPDMNGARTASVVHQPLFPSLSVGLGASVIAHVGLLLAVSRGPVSAGAFESADRDDSPVEIEMAEPFEDQAAEPLDTQPPRPAVRSSRLQRHHHPYPVPADHDAIPHDARLKHERGAVAPIPPERSGVASAGDPAPAGSRPQGTPRFTLSVVVRPRGLVSAIGADDRAHGGDVDDDGDGPGGVIAESGVTTRARLQSSVPPTYPPAARQGDIEADVPLEIVVDTAGRVRSSRALGQSGYGLDEAAIAAIARYRFFPAQRDGHPVRVRMRWVVQFRLR